MSTRSRQSIFGSRLSGATIRAEGARQAARQAIRAADRAEAEAWSIRMEGYGGPAQPSPTIAQCLNGGYGWLQVKCRRCETEASIPLQHVRRPRSTPIWKLEAALKCRSCRTRRYSPHVRMIKLTEQRELSPYVLVHPDEERVNADPPECPVLGDERTPLRRGRKSESDPGTDMTYLPLPRFACTGYHDPVHSGARDSS